MCARVMLRMLYASAGPRLQSNFAARCCSMAVSAAPQPQAERRVIKGIVFDMDGTLTKAVIDFAEMRRSVAAVGGLEKLSGDILDIIGSWPADQQQAAHAAIAVVEAQALRDMQLMPGVLDLSRFLDERRVPRALVTRNVNSSIEFFHRHHFTLPPFTPALSREFAPYKPDPASLLHIAQRWSVQPGELVMIGDSAKDDIVCGNRAGALTILLDEERRWESAEQLQGEERPHFIARSLQDVQQLLEQQVELVPPAAEAQPLT